LGRKTNVKKKSISRPSFVPHRVALIAEHGRQGRPDVGARGGRGCVREAHFADLG
jgi:hypothetical protein